MNTEYLNSFEAGFQHYKEGNFLSGKEGREFIDGYNAAYLCELQSWVEA